MEPPYHQRYLEALGPHPTYNWGNSYEASQEDYEWGSPAQLQVVAKSHELSSRVDFGPPTGPSAFWER